MREFKTAKIKKGYMFYDENHRVILKNPSIQAHDEFSIITDDNDNGIMYYYYDLEYYYRQRRYIKKKNRWEPVYKWVRKFEKRVTDFPALLSLQSILNHIKEVDIETEGQKVHYRDGSIGYRYTYDTEGFACEDMYEISKFYHNGDVSYSLFIGSGLTFDPDIDSFGVRFDRLTSKSFRQFKRFVDKFIEYSIEINNEGTLGMIKRDQNSRFIKGDTIYYFDTFKGRGIQSKDDYIIDELEDAYKVGDVVDIHIANACSIREATYNYVEIIEINEKDNTVTVKNLRKDEHEGEINVVNMDNVAYISLEYDSYEEMKERVNKIKQKGEI